MSPTDRIAVNVARVVGHEILPYDAGRPPVRCVVCLMCGQLVDFDRAGWYHLNDRRAPIPHGGRP